MPSTVFPPPPPPPSSRTAKEEDEYYAESPIFSSALYLPSHDYDYDYDRPSTTLTRFAAVGKQAHPCTTAVTLSSSFHGPKTPPLETVAPPRLPSSSSASATYSMPTKLPVPTRLQLFPYCERAPKALRSTSGQRRNLLDDCCTSDWTWVVTRDIVEPLPVLYPPLQPTTAVKLEHMAVEQISGRISNFMRVNSILSSHHCRDMARITCQTPTCLRFTVQLWRYQQPVAAEEDSHKVDGTTKEQANSYIDDDDDDVEPTIIMEVQRRQGCSIEMQRLRRGLIQFVQCKEDDDKQPTLLMAMPPVTPSHCREPSALVKRLYQDAFPRQPTPQDPQQQEAILAKAAATSIPRTTTITSTSSHSTTITCPYLIAAMERDLESCLELLESSQLDQNMLGMEGLGILTDPAKVGPEKAEWVARVLLLTSSHRLSSSSYPRELELDKSQPRGALSSSDAATGASTTCGMRLRAVLEDCLAHEAFPLEASSEDFPSYSHDMTQTLALQALRNSLGLLVAAAAPTRRMSSDSRSRPHDQRHHPAKGSEVEQHFQGWNGSVGSLPENILEGDTVSQRGESNSSSFEDSWSSMAATTTTMPIVTSSKDDSSSTFCFWNTQALHQFMDNAQDCPMKAALASRCLSFLETYLTSTTTNNQKGKPV
jgi:hypothetical protein